MTKFKETGTGGSQSKGQSQPQVKGPGQVDPIAPRKKQQSTHNIDLKHRDPQDLNTHVRVSPALFSVFWASKFWLVEVEYIRLVWECFCENYC